MYKKIYEQGRGENKHLIHLWTDEGYKKIEWNNYAYKECSPEDAEFKGLKGEPLRKTHTWDRKTPKLHFSDISAHQKFLIEKYFFSFFRKIIVVCTFNNSNLFNF